MQLLKRRTDQLVLKNHFYLIWKHSQLSKRRVGLYKVLLSRETLSKVAFLQKKSRCEFIQFKHEYSETADSRGTEQNTNVSVSSRPGWLYAIAWRP
jgi:hypothetical protein